MNIDPSVGAMLFELLILAGLFVFGLRRAASRPVRPVPVRIRRKNRSH
jgi:hypothetical protein